MDNEREIVIFKDEDGSEYEMEIVEYFEYDNEDYAMLIEADTNHEHTEDCDENGCVDEVDDVYIMQVEVDDESGEEILHPIADDKLDEIVDALDEFFNEEEELEEETELQLS
ncbi:MAG: DUF1292 domain-containing protein [Clostridiales bacterium]|nr:DUF1292 domain-containing protein [Clostridiales bacterium]